MRVALQISTGLLLEMQSHAAVGTLQANAGVSFPGIAVDDIEEREVDAAQFAQILTNQPAPVPEQASSGDFVHALHDLGWLPAVEAAVAGAGPLAQALWRHASTFERHHPLVLEIAEAIGKTDADLDTLFRKTREYR